MRIRIKQTWGIIILSVFVLAYLAIYSWNFFQEKGEITKIYFADRITATHKILIDRYNEMNKDRVEVIPIDFPNFDFSTNERKEILARSLRSRGDGIDVLAVDVIWVQRFAKWCEPLENYFSKEERDQILDVCLKSCYSNNILYAIPFNLAQGVMYYRKDLVQQLFDDKTIKKIKEGITWEEFIQLGLKTNYKNPFYIFPAADYEGLICSFNESILSLDSNYYIKNGFSFETPEAKKSLRNLVDLVNKYKFTPKLVTSFTEVPSFKYFQESDALFLRGWPSYDKDFINTNLEILDKSKFDFAPIPHFKDGKKASTLGGWDLMISKFSDNKKESAEFIKYLLSDSSQEEFYNVSRLYPVVSHLYQDEGFVKRHPEIIKYRSNISTAVSRPTNVEYTRFSKIMSYYFSMAIQNKISVDEALKKTTSSIKQDIITLDEFLK